MAGAGDLYGYTDNYYRPGTPFPGMSNTGGRAAYGTRPSAPPAASTAPTVVPQAINLGQSVYQQLPGYNATLGNVGANLKSETAGELPEDVVRQLSQRAAERGVSIGSPGSPNANASLLQSLGLTSLDLTRQGQAGLESILPHLPGYDIARSPGFYVTPGEQYESGLQQSIFGAMPDPYASAMAGLDAAKTGYGVGMGSVRGGGGGGMPTVGFDNAPDPWYTPPSAVRSGPAGYTMRSGVQTEDAAGGYTGGNFVNGMWKGSGLDDVTAIAKTYDPLGRNVDYGGELPPANTPYFGSNIPAYPDLLALGE